MSLPKLTFDPIRGSFSIVFFLLFGFSFNVDVLEIFMSYIVRLQNISNQEDQLDALEGAENKKQNLSYIDIINQDQGISDQDILDETSMRRSFRAMELLTTAPANSKLIELKWKAISKC